MAGGGTEDGASGGDSTGEADGAGDSEPSRFAASLAAVRSVAWRRILRLSTILVVLICLAVGPLMLLADRWDVNPLLLTGALGVLLPAVVGLVTGRAESFEDTEKVLLAAVTVLAVVAGTAAVTLLRSMADDREVDVTRRAQLSEGGQWRGGELYELAIGKPPERERLALRWKVDDDSPGSYLGNCLSETRLHFRGADVARETEVSVEEERADIPVESHGGGRSSIEVSVSGDSACEFSLDITSAVLRNG